MEDVSAGRLRRARIEKAPGLTQEAFARLLGFTTGASYRRYECGMRKVPRHLAAMVLLIEQAGIPDSLRAAAVRAARER